MLDDLKFIDQRDLHDALGVLEREYRASGVRLDGWLATVPTDRNLAKRLALEAIGVSVVVVSGPLLAPAAKSWKQAFNARAHQLCWQEELAKADYAPFLAWTKQPVQKPYRTIELRSNLEAPWVTSVLSAAERLLSGLRPEPIVVQAQGESLERQLTWLTALAAFVATYVALLNNVDPNPDEQTLVEKFRNLEDN